MNKRFCLLSMVCTLCTAVSMHAQENNRYWSFDSENDFGDKACNILLDEGVMNGAALFNGINSEWIESSITDLSSTFYMEAWIAPQEYSFNQSAIVNQQHDFHEGFLFGINHLGELVGSIASDGRWLTCLTETKIPLLTWSHVAMSFSADAGIRLFINGKPEGELKMKLHPRFAKKTPLVIGKTQAKMPAANTERATSLMQKSWMYFDGLIDELYLLSNIPTDKIIKQRASGNPKLGSRVLEYRKMPSGTFGQGPFGAYYTRLMYTPAWESQWKVSEHTDVVVRFPDNPVKFVFWRGTGYSSSIVSANDIFVCDQSAENFSTGECYEVMSDKQCRYSHVRILETTPARCVIHWRYALTGINFDIYREKEDGWGEWVDEYWTIFPDGVANRKQILHSEHFKDNKGGYQLQSTMFFSQPGTRPQDNVQTEALEFIDFDGNKAIYSWEKEIPLTYNKTQYQPIQLLKLEAEHSLFCIFPPENRSTAMKFGWTEGFSNFSCWDHWPVTQNKSDGRVATMSDRVSHTCITDVNGRNQLVEYGPDNTVVSRQLLGMTNQPIEALIPLGRSWNFPPEPAVKNDNFDCAGYDVYQRAYIFTRKTNDGSALEFSLPATVHSPVHNMSLVIDNWEKPGAIVIINGKELQPDVDYTTGYLPTLTGDKMVLWINHQTTGKIDIQIK